MFKKERWYPMMLALLLAAGIVAAGYAAGQRYNLEAGNRRVELAMPYAELQRLAGLAGKQPVEVMKLFRERGLTAVFFPESTVEEGKKSGEFIVLTGRELYFLSRAGGDFSAWLGSLVDQGKISAADTCFLTTEESSARRLAGQLKIKAPDAAVRVYAPPAQGNNAGNPRNASGGGANAFVVCVSAGLDALAGLGLGFPAGPLAESALAGLNAIVQVRNWPGATEAGLAKFFQPLQDIPNLSAIAFYGNSVPGYPEHLPVLAKNVKNLGVPVVQIEFHPQKGLAALGALLDGQVLRLHSADPEELKISSFAALRSRFLLAAAERNVRVLLIYPLVGPGAGDFLAQNLEFVSTLKQELQQKGLAAGPGQPLPPLVQPGWLLFLMGLGVIAGGMGVLRQAGVFRLCPLIGLVAAVGWAGVLVGAPEAGTRLMAFAAAVIFPVFSVQANLPSSPATIPRSVLLFLRTTFFSLGGALLIVGLLADTRYMLKLDQFAGVKAAYVFPLLCLAVIFAWRGFGQAEIKDVREHVARLFNQPVLFKWVVAAVLLLMVLAVYLLRTGTQEIIPPSSLELKVRAILEHLLVVRPRTKEFLIGHPFLLLLFYTGYRDNRFLPLLLLGAIGQISVVNTFVHIHTPLAVSGLRTIHGLWLGVCVGLIFIFLWNLVISRYGKKFCWR